jgi:hypothetical protein
VAIPRLWLPKIEDCLRTLVITPLARLMVIINDLYVLLEFQGAGVKFAWRIWVSLNKVRASPLSEGFMGCNPKTEQQLTSIACFMNVLNIHLMSSLKKTQGVASLKRSPAMVQICSQTSTKHLGRCPLLFSESTKYHHKIIQSEFLMK